MLRLFQKPLRSNPPFPMSETLLEDLDLLEYLKRFFDEPARYVSADAEAIRERNDICKAMLRNEALTAAIRRLVDVSAQISETAGVAESEPILIIRSMAGVKRLREAVVSLVQAIEADGELPAAFGDLSEALLAFLDKKYPPNIDEAWQKYAQGVEKTGSMSWQVRFSRNLMIDTIALKSVHSHHYVKKSPVSLLSGAPESMRVDSLFSLTKPDLSFLDRMANSETARMKDSLLHGDSKQAALQRFSYTLREILVSHSAGSKNQLNAMERNITGELYELVNELRFALGMVQYVQVVRKHSPHVCFAEIRDQKERTLRVLKMVHPVLAESAAVVANDVSIQNGSELVLLGGVNRGGKTTYLRTAGAMQLLFQMGLPVPAESAEISPASGIFSVFSREENTELTQGKLGQELTGMRNAISALDDCGFFMGNEPISATSPAESYLLSRESLGMLKARHARGVWVTHLYGLFNDTDKLNALDFGSLFSPMHTDSSGGERSFVILPGIPEKYSGAREVFYHP